MSLCFFACCVLMGGHNNLCKQILHLLGQRDKIQAMEDPVVIERAIMCWPHRNPQNTAPQTRGLNHCHTHSQFWDFPHKHGSGIIHINYMLRRLVMHMDSWWGWCTIKASSGPINKKKKEAKSQRKWCKGLQMFSEVWYVKDAHTAVWRETFYVAMFVFTKTFRARLYISPIYVHKMISSNEIMYKLLQ